MPESDAERLRRLRERQLRDRDPLARQRRLDGEIARKQRRLRQSFSLGRMWAEIPHRWRGLILGLIVGLLLLLAAPSLIAAPWGTCLGAATLPFAALIGFLVGRYQDTVDDIRDHLH